MKQILHIDMDGVLCDFYGPFNKMRSGELPFPQSKIGFFENLEPMPHAIASYKLLERYFDVWILTRPSFYNLNCYTEKAQWVKNHLGFCALQHLILCGDKSLLKGDFLIDDTGNDGQDRFEGKWLKFGSETFPDWISVTNYLIK